VRVTPEEQSGLARGRRRQRVDAGVGGSRGRRGQWREDDGGARERLCDGGAHGGEHAPAVGQLQLQRGGRSPAAVVAHLILRDAGVEAPRLRCLGRAFLGAPAGSIGARPQRRRHRVERGGIGRVGATSRKFFRGKPNLGCWGLGFMVQGPGFTDHGSGVQDSGAGFRVQSLGFRLQG